MKNPIPTLVIIGVVILIALLYFLNRPVKSPEIVVLPKSVEPSQVEPAPIPPRVEVPVKVPMERIIIFVDRERREFWFNLTGRKLIKDPKYEVHIQYGYTYEVIRVTPDFGFRHEQLKWKPETDSVVIGLFDIPAGKYLASVRVMADGGDYRLLLDGSGSSLQVTGVSMIYPTVS